MYELPYGNTQQLNLDWFIQRWKEFYEEWEQTKTEIDGALDEEVQKVEDAMEDLYAARDAAAASATAAAASAASANNDATIAANAATAAAASATLANTKATAAGLSEAASALSASQAANDATAAATSASQASASASSATDSAQAAAASATAADSSADDAADSATAAAGSATAAAGSASDAADSATAAAASAASLVVDSAMSDSSTNPVQNKVINGELTELKTAITECEGNIQVLAKFHHDDLTWADIQRIVQNGVAPDWFAIGDQLEIGWNGNTLEWDVVSFDDVELQNGNIVLGMWLQSHYAMEGIQFDASEAIYIASSALPAGTYNFTIGTTWGSNCVAGKTYQFTTTKEIPVGGQIAVGKNNDWYTWGAPDVAPSNWRVHTFSSNADTTPLESNLTLIEGSGGTALGSVASNIKYGTSGMNNLQRAAYGYSRWSQSANRQYYNSSAASGAWWTPQNPFDRAPQELASQAGFMAGFDSDFLAVLKPIKVVTALNTVSDTDIGTSEATYDTFFLPSLEQEYIVPQLAGVEGAYWQYWKERLGLDSPQVQGSDGASENHIRYAYNAKTTAQTCRLRSAHRGSAYYAWNVYKSGYAGFSNATYAYRGCPACVIC